MTINSVTGEVSWPSPTISGSPHTVTIRASNLAGADEETWQLTVFTSPGISPMSNEEICEHTQYTSPQPVLVQGAEPITWSLISPPHPDVMIDSATGIVTWTDPPGSLSPYNLTVRATNNVGSGDVSWQLTVLYGPDINNISPQTVAEGSLYTGPSPVLLQGAPATWSIVAAPSGMDIEASSGIMSWSNPIYSPTPYSITLRADNNCGSGEVTWLLTVVIPPVIENIPDATIASGTVYTGPTPVLVQDTFVTWSLIDKPTGMTINSSTGVVNWPNPTKTGSPHAVTIRATNQAGTDDEIWLLTVLAPPVIVSINNASIPKEIPSGPSTRDHITGTTPLLNTGVGPT